MSLILDVPQSVERERAAQAVRSRLSPEERYKFDRGGYKRDYQDRLFADSEAKKTAPLKKDNGRSRTDKDQAIGCPLHSDVFMRRLLQLNASLWFEQSNADPEKIGIYLVVPITPEYIEGRKFLMGFHHGIMPEYTLQREPGPDGENVGILRQGYRTILQRLVRLRLISLAQVEVMFGPDSKDSGFWAVLTGKRATL